jgi:hypothetical protein
VWPLPSLGAAKEITWTSDLSAAYCDTMWPCILSCYHFIGALYSRLLQTSRTTTDVCAWPLLMKQKCDARAGVLGVASFVTLLADQNILPDI